MPSGIRQNRMKGVLDSGGVALGFGVLTFSPAVIEVVGRAGVDFIWLDLQHTGFSPYDSIAMENLVRAAENAGVAVLVRLPENNAAMIAKILDTGAHSILVPDIENKDETVKAVAAAKYEIKSFPSIRGAPVSRSSAWSAPDKAFAEASDSQILVGIMIESRKAVENLDEILSVEGIDYVFVGPYDLSVSLGIPFQPTHVIEKEYISRIREACQRRRIPVGIPVSDSHAAKEAVKEGFSIVRIGVDLPLISRSVTSLVNEIREYR